MTTISAQAGFAPPPLVKVARVLACAFLVLMCLPVLPLPGGIPPASALTIVALPFWFGAAIQRAGPIFDPPGVVAASVIVVCAFVISVWALASVVDAESPGRAARPILSMLVAIGILFLTVGTLTHWMLKGYLNLLLAALAATCLFSLAAVWIPSFGDLVFQDGDRAYGTFKNPNQFGIAISTTLPVALALFVARKGRSNFHLVVIAALIMGLVLSGSKANVLTVAGMTPVCLVAFSVIRHTGLTRVKKIAAALASYLVGSLIVYGLLAILNPRALELLGVIFRPDEDLASFASRAAAWSASIEQMLDDPIFGQGAGQVLVGTTHSHNIFLDYLRTMGVPGGAMIIILIATVLLVAFSALWLSLRAHHADKDDRVLCFGLWAGAISYLAANLSSDSMGPSTSTFFFVVVFFGMAARTLLRDSRQPPSTSFASSSSETRDTPQAHSLPSDRHATGTNPSSPR